MVFMLCYMFVKLQFEGEKVVVLGVVEQVDIVLLYLFVCFWQWVKGQLNVFVFDDQVLVFDGWVFWRGFYFVLFVWYKFCFYWWFVGRCWVWLGEVFQEDWDFVFIIKVYFCYVFFMEEFCYNFVFM